MLGLQIASVHVRLVFCFKINCLFYELTGLHCLTCGVQWRIFLWKWKWWADKNSTIILHCFTFWWLWRSHLLHTSDKLNFGQTLGSFSSSGKGSSWHWVSDSTCCHWWPAYKSPFLQRAIWWLHRNTNYQSIPRRTANVPNFWHSSSDEDVV